MPYSRMRRILMSHQSNKVTASVTKLSPEDIKIKDPVDTMPSDYQPPGIDNEDRVDYNSLEEALTS